MPSYFDSNSSLNLNSENRRSGWNEEAEAETTVSHNKPHKERKWKPLECVQIAKEYLAHQQKEKTLDKKIEETKNLTKEKVNPQTMENPIIPRDMSNIMKILLAILWQNQVNQSLFD